ncbi:hypothetical protein GGR51DRAFT_297979 [Nemania sp. FL0031]|nr:hypothetical protein GGR51DRAFT_297979 [Nemania sp. FL0031]
MDSRETAPSETSRISRTGRLSHDDISLGGRMDADDDEEGGTSLARSVAAAQSHNESNVSSRRNNSSEGTRRTPRTYPFLRKGANRALGWFLGRHIQLNCEDSTMGLGTQDRDHVIGDDFFDIGDVQDICPACTTPYCQAIDSIPFKSSLELMYNDPTSQRWLVGNKYVLDEAIDDHPDDEYVPLVEATTALKTLAPSVPTLKVRTGWKENGKVITISDVVPGERLYDIWWDLSDKEREHIATQVAGYIENWRESDLGRISGLTGGPVYYHDNLFGTTEDGFGPFGSDLHLWEAIESRLVEKGVDEDTIQFLKDYMPPSSPCVFTHGDLSTRNVIVHEGEVVALTGFENAASLPAWAEDVAMHFCCCTEDERWKALLLSKHARSRHHGAALDWWSLWTAVEDSIANAGKAVDREQEELRLENLKERCRRWKKTESIRSQPFWSEATKRPNVQTTQEKAAEDHVGDPVHRAIDSDLVADTCFQYMSHSSWGGSDDEDGDKRRSKRVQGTKKGGTRKKRGVAPYHQIQQQHDTLMTSANQLPRQTTEAQKGERGGDPPKLSGPGRGRVVKVRDLSDSDIEFYIETLVDGLQGRPPSRVNPQLPEAPREQNSGLRPLSLPSYAASEVMRSHPPIADTTTTKMGDADDPDTAKEGRKAPKDEEPQTGGESSSPAQKLARRTSIFNNRAAPGSFYATISAASTEARPKRHERSRSEDRGQGDEDRVNVSHRRPQSMLPSTPPDLSGRGPSDSGKKSP